VKRRRFTGLLSGVIATRPDRSWAQLSGNAARIGIIDNAPIWDHFRQGLRDAGRIEGRNVAFDYVVADGKPDRLAVAAADLVRIPVDLIATFGTPASVAAKAATGAIPIIAISIGDPVRAGLAASIARPGANVTGNTILGPDIGAKRLQLIKEVVPTATRVAVLWNPDNASNTAILEELQAAGPKMGLTLLSIAVRKAAEFATALPNMMRGRPDVFMMANDPLHQQHVGTIIDFSRANKLPAMFQIRENVVAGGLMSYGPSLTDLFRRGGIYAQKVLQGTKPTDLPFEQPTTFELVINLKTAKALNLTIPPSILARADEVIE
jgi:putative ABC transport system substrate-binding protein